RVLCSSSQRVFCVCSRPVTASAVHVDHMLVIIEAEVLPEPDFQVVKTAFVHGDLVGAHRLFYVAQQLVVCIGLTHNENASDLDGAADSFIVGLDPFLELIILNSLDSTIINTEMRDIQEFVR